MYKIDLLKGNGMPIRQMQGMVYIISGSLIVPVIILLMMLSSYFTLGVSISTAAGQIKQVERSLANYAPQIEIQKLIDQQIKSGKYSIDESLAIINTQLKWTPVIIDIVQNQPAKLVMESLFVSENSYSIKKPSSGDPKKEITVKKVDKVINLKYNAPQDSEMDYQVTNYVRLLNEKGLKSKITNQDIVTNNNKSFKTYRVECIIK